MPSSAGHLEHYNSCEACEDLAREAEVDKAELEGLRVTVAKLRAQIGGYEFFGAMGEGK